MAENQSKSKTTLSEALPVSDKPTSQQVQGDVLGRMGVEFGKNKDLTLFLLRLMQKQEVIRGLRVELDRAEADGMINPMQASITRVQMALQEGQDILLAALDPVSQKQLMNISNGMSTMAQWLSPPNEAYYPVYLAIEDALQEHQAAMLSRAGHDDYNTMMNVFRIFTTSKVEQKIEQKTSEPIKKEGGNKWLP